MQWESPKPVLAEPRFFTEPNKQGKLTKGDVGWGFHYPLGVVKLGYTLWKRSNFTQIPDPEYLLNLDQDWLTDLRLAHAIVEHKKPDNGNDW